jgi:hypothetical protein
MRSGKPCPARERRASSAPACRIAARSWSLSGCRAVSPGVLRSARPAAGVRASRAGAGPGTGPPPDLRIRQRPPLAPIARPAPAARRRCLCWCRCRVRVHLVIRAGPVTSAPPSGAWQDGSLPWRGAGCVPRVRRSRRTGRPATGRGRIRPVRPVDDAAGGFTGPGPVMGIVRGSSGVGRVGQAGGCPFRSVVAWSHAAGRGFAGHGSASRPVCRPGWSSAERGARVGSGGVYAVSCPVAVRQACSTARSRVATRVSRAAIACRLRRP